MSYPFFSVRFSLCPSCFLGLLPKRNYKMQDFEILLFDKSSLTLVSRIHRRKKKKVELIKKKPEDTAKKEICHLEWKLVQYVAYNKNFSLI